MLSVYVRLSNLNTKTLIESTPFFNNRQSCSTMH